MELATIFGEEKDVLYICKKHLEKLKKDLASLRPF